MTDSIDEAIDGREGVSVAKPEDAPDAFLSDPSRVITARGTEDGLVLRIDGRAEWREILDDLEAFLGKRRRFLEGGQVSLEWLERLPTREQSKELDELLQTRYGIEIAVRRRRPSSVRLAKGEKVSKNTRDGGVTIPLFDEVPGNRAQVSMHEVRLSDDSSESGFGQGEEFSVQNPCSSSSLSSSAALAQGNLARNSLEHGAFDHSSLLGLESGSNSSRGVNYISATSKRYLSQVSKLLGEDSFYEEDANAKVVFATLRSGQRLETPFSLVVVGDVNPGADLIAGGDIIVMGSLRGTAHASAYDDDSFDHVIIALRMQPMQLRIGSVISRGSDEQVKGAEIARIENRRIIVEQFSPRDFLARKVR